VRRHRWHDDAHGCCEPAYGDRCGGAVRPQWHCLAASSVWDCGASAAIRTEAHRHWDTAATRAAVRARAAVPWRRLLTVRGFSGALPSPETQTTTRLTPASWAACRVLQALARPGLPFPARRAKKPSHEAKPWTVRHCCSLFAPSAARCRCFCAPRSRRLSQLARLLAAAALRLPAASCRFEPRRRLCLRARRSSKLFAASLDWWLTQAT